VKTTAYTAFCALLFPDVIKYSKFYTPVHRLLAFTRKHEEQAGNCSEARGIYRQLLWSMGNTQAIQFPTGFQAGATN